MKSKRVRRKRPKTKRKKRIRGRNHLYAGQKMASHSEVVFAQKCDREGIPWLYEPEHFLWTPPIAKYTPDFKIFLPDGSFFWIEYKGFLRGPEKLKMAQMKLQHPHEDIRIIFEKALKPVQGAKPRKNGTKLTHAEWAIKHKYRWAEKFIPTAWMKGE